VFRAIWYETPSVLLREGLKLIRYDQQIVQVATGAEVWSGPLSNGVVAAVFLNNSPNQNNVSATFGQLGLSGITNHAILLVTTLMSLPADSASVRDLWAHQDLGVFSSSYTVTLASHACAMLTFTPSTSSTI